LVRTPWRDRRKHSLDHGDLLARCELYRRILARYDWVGDGAEAGAVAAGVV
jgi:hypothetical protein